MYKVGSILGVVQEANKGDSEKWFYEDELEEAEKVFDEYRRKDKTKYAFSMMYHKLVFRFSLK